MGLPAICDARVSGCVDDSLVGAYIHLSFEDLSCSIGGVVGENGVRHNRMEVGFACSAVGKVVSCCRQAHDSPSCCMA